MGGYATRYVNDFDFVTIRGAGHMVPEYKPEAAFVMTLACKKMSGSSGKKNNGPWMTLVHPLVVGILDTHSFHQHKIHQLFLIKGSR